MSARSGEFLKETILHLVGRCPDDDDDADDDTDDADDYCGIKHIVAYI